MWRVELLSSLRGACFWTETEVLRECVTLMLMICRVSCVERCVVHHSIVIIAGDKRPANPQ